MIKNKTPPAVVDNPTVAGVLAVASIDAGVPRVLHAYVMRMAYLLLLHGIFTFAGVLAMAGFPAVTGVLVLSSRFFTVYAAGFPAVVLILLSSLLLVCCWYPAFAGFLAVAGNVVCSPTYACIPPTNV